MSTSSSPSPDPGDGPLQAPLSNPTPVDSQTLQEEWQALRIQVAAVAAQQAGLIEEDCALEQKRTALIRQEEQLAAHFEARDQRLLHKQDRIRSEQQRLTEEQQAWKLQQKADRAQLAKERQAAQAAERQAQADRRQLQTLRRRLYKRWKRNFAAEQTRLRTLETKLQQQRSALEIEANRLRKERDALARDRLAFNTAGELSKRELLEGWSTLHQLQRQQEDRRNSELADLDNRTKALDEREAALIWKERLLVDQKRRWQEKQASLAKEAAGLENRVRNHRCRLLDTQNASAISEPVLQPAFEPTPSTHGLPVEPDFLGVEAKHQLIELGRTAAVLSDQRLILFEHMGRLLNVWQSWHAEHQNIETELRKVAGQLVQREQRVADRESALEDLARNLQYREVALRQAENQAEAEKAYVCASEAKLEKDRDALLIDMHSQEIQISARQARLTELRRRWLKRRREELDQIENELARLFELRDHYSATLAANSDRSATLERQARRLAEKALALEEYRLEIAGQAPEAARAEKRIRHLRRQWAKLFAVSERNLLRERRLLSDEAVHQNRLAKNLEIQADDLAVREAYLSVRMTEWECGKLKTVDAAAKWEADVQSLQSHLRLSNRQTTHLKDELERLALVLLGDDKHPALSLMRAA
ncbi:MAG: hypothetical protein ACJ8FY_20025 [Gemmataceae bacterium]